MECFLQNRSCNHKLTAAKIPPTHCCVVTARGAVVGVVTFSFPLLLLPSSTISLTRREEDDDDAHTFCKIPDKKIPKINGTNPLQFFPVQERQISFLAQLEALISATYFVGTFDSNVGAIAAVLRKCHYSDAPHYAHSYGVDRDEWYLRS